MTQQTLTFSSEKSEAAKTLGMEVAAANNIERLRLAQGYAVGVYCRLGRPISIDDVYHRLAIDGQRPELLGNSCGSIFKAPGWKSVGFTNSTRVSNHSRIVRLWVRR